MEDTMEEFPVPTESEAATFWPFLLLVAALAVGYWFWSSSTTGGATSAAAPLPNAEELRKKRLEALSKAEPAPPPPARREERGESLGAAVDGERPSYERKRMEQSKADEEGLRLRRVEAESKTETSTKPPSPPGPQVPTAEAQQKIEKDVKAKDLSVPNAQEDAMPKEDAAPKDEVSKTVSASSALTLRARATLQGKSQVRNLEVPVEANLEQLQTEILKAFPEAADSKVRIFFNGKELKTSTATVESIGLSSNICLQVMFAALRPPPVEPVAPIAEPAGKDEVPKGDSAEAPAEEALSVRIQGTVQGSTSAFVIKELTTCSQVLDLEALSLGAFAPGQGLRPRLFFMGKELKDGNAFLGNVGLKPTSTATVQVMFATGDPRVTARTPVDVGGAAVASASAAAGGRPSPVLEEGTNEAVMAMADAGGCDVSVLTGAQSDAGGGAVASPADAWRAMAGLEEQLSRESDQSEEPSVRQASKMLRQLLTTATHDSNPGLMQMAQTAVPDLKMIWNFEPTREHLRGVLAQSQIQ